MPPAGLTPARIVLLGAAAVFLLALVAHGRSIRGEFLWDDEYFIKTNPVIADHHEPWGYWTDGRLRDYFPLTLTLFYVQKELLDAPPPSPAPAPPGLARPQAPQPSFSPVPYRAVNVILHALACVAVYLVLRELKVPWAWLGAALFAVHPVTAASAGWISEQKNTLSLWLGALALLAFVRFQKGGRWWLYALSAGAFAAALLAKTSTVVLPAMLLAALWWQRRPLWNRRTMLPLAGLFLLAAAAGAVTLWYHSHNAVKHTNLYGPQGAVQRLLLAGKVIGFYAAKSILPVRLNMHYPKWDPASVDWTALAIPGLVAWAGVLLACRRRHWARPAAALTACFVLALAPVAGLIDMSFMQFSFVSDHLMYLALPVPAAAAAGLLGCLALRGRAWRRGALAAAAVLLVVLTGATSERAKVFASNYALWRDTVTKNPASWLGHGNLGNLLEQAGKGAAAARQFELAVTLSPPGRDIAYRHCLASVLLRMNKPAEAAHVLEGSQWAQGDDPAYKAAARQLLARILRQLSQYDRARENYEAALAQTDIPTQERATTLNELAGLLLDHLDQPALAADYAGRAVQLSPDNPEFLDTLGWAHFRGGRADEAQDLLTRAIGLRAAPIYRYHLGMVLEARGQTAEAIRQYRLGLGTAGGNRSDEYSLKIKERLDVLQPR